jgi:hypothetical protein
MTTTVTQLVAGAAKAAEARTNLTATDAGQLCEPPGTGRPAFNSNEGRSSNDLSVTRRPRGAGARPAPRPPARRRRGGADGRRARIGVRLLLLLQPR